MDYFYYDVTIHNSNDFPTPAEYLETKDDIIVKDLSQYKLSLDKAAIPVNSVPIKRNFNEEEYVIRLSSSQNGGISVESQLDTIRAVSPNKPKNVYFYGQVLEAINSTISQLHTDLKALSGGALTESLDPQMKEVRDKFELRVPLSFGDPATDIKIEFNNKLAVLFQGIYMEQDAQTRYYSFVYTSNFETNSDYYLLEQEKESRSLWSEATKILITSSTLKTGDESLSTLQSNGENYTLPILLDIDTMSMDSANSNSSLQYQPFLRRWISFRSGGLLRTVQISILVYFRDQSVEKLELFEGTNITLKFLFQKIK